MILSQVIRYTCIKLISTINHLWRLVLSLFDLCKEVRSCQLKTKIAHFILVFHSSQSNNTHFKIELIESCPCQVAWSKFSCLEIGHTWVYFIKCRYWRTYKVCPHPALNILNFKVRFKHPGRVLFQVRISNRDLCFNDIIFKLLQISRNRYKSLPPSLPSLVVSLNLL